MKYSKLVSQLVSQLDSASMEGQAFLFNSEASPNTYYKISKVIDVARLPWTLPSPPQKKRKEKKVSLEKLHPKDCYILN